MSKYIYRECYYVEMSKWGKNGTVPSSEMGHHVVWRQVLTFWRNLLLWR